MAKRNTRVWIAVGVVVLCGASYLGLYSNHWNPLPPPKPNNFSEQKNKQDSSYLAYQTVDGLSLIAGVEKQGDNVYVGTPAWQTSRDLLGFDAPSIKGQLHLLALNRFEGEQDGTYVKGAAVFRIDTQGDHPVQALGVQPLRYDAKSKRVLAEGKPLLAVVSPADGKIDYEFMALSADGDPAMLRFGKTGRTPQGYQRTDAGLIAFTIASNRLRLTLHYIANLAPPDGHCSVGQATPCLKIVTTFASAESDRDYGTIGFDSVKLDSTRISEQGQQTHSYRLRYDPARFAFLRFTGQGIDQIESLSPAKADAFLASLPLASKAGLK